MCAAFFTYIDKFENLSFSGAEGDIYDIEDTVIPAGTMEGDHYALSLLVNLNHDEINYLRVTADGIGDNDNVTLDFGAYTVEKIGEKWIPVFAVNDIKLHDGVNDIRLPGDDFRIGMVEVSGIDKIVIKGLQFRQYVRKASPWIIIPYLIAVLAAYCFLTAAAFRIWYRKKRRELKDAPVQTAGRRENTNAAIALNRRLYPFPMKTSVIITAVFCLMITISLLMEMSETEYIHVFGRYFTVQMVLCLAVLVFSAAAKTKKRQFKTDRAAIITWGVFAAYTLISDILVAKPFRFAEILIFAVLLMLGYIWSTYKENTGYIRCFEIAVQIFLAILLILTLVKRPEAGADRFSGPIENPSVYALYLGAIWAVLLASLENHIKNRESKVTLVLTIAEMILVLALLYSAQSLTPLIAVFLTSALWLLRLIIDRKGLRFALTLYLIMGTAAIIGLVVLIWYVRSADVESGSRLIQKLESANMTTILARRNYYWREYISEMNLFGHGEKPYLWGHKTLPHNALIGLAYMYGVPCIVPYIIMMIMAVEKSYRFADRPVRYSAVPLYCIVSFIIMSLADNVEQPFVWLPWIACYLMMAPVMVRSVEEIESLGGTK